ncbi:tuftelin-interacting protein 11-like [Symsagittifera roscoffensis]|uniref:tuftelin-interacting protein 11-like n=1 Tax=Symsagittifera roscoffensis TaxID=84072 RepID=UPI00307C3459
MASNSIRSSERLIEILEAWSPLLPKNIFINIVEQFLIPRLQEALDSWNPVSDTVPVHSWIHPWLPLLGDRLQPLFVTIRTKLAQCLVNWDPTDRSAKMIIEPWRDVFSKGEMEAFLIKAICPKLKMALHLMPLDNTSSGIELLRSVLIWHDLLSLHQLSQILVAHFFPKWIQCLCVWLSNQPNFDEVEKWYRAWRNEFPIQLLALNETKASFKQAMDMMTRSVSGSSVMGYEYVTPIPQHPGPPTHNMGGMPQHQYHPYNNSAHHPIYNYNMPATAADGYVPHSILRLQQQSGVDSSSASMMQLDTFRDLVERRCSELNLLFAPVPGVFHDSRQVYTLGTVKVCIDKGVLFVNKGGGGTKWQPMALPAVLSYAKDR